MTLELVCLGIVGLYVVARAALDLRPRTVLVRLGVLALAAWLVEDAAIRAYGFYEYGDVWWPVVDRVPVLIALIWPVVIHSAWDLARALASGRGRAVPWLAGALVLADAALIEPISVAAGLWRWTEPGPFDVPPIGVLGWGLFGGLAAHGLERGGALRTLVVPVLATHAALVGVWWLALRWLSTPLEASYAVAAAWLASLLVTGHVLVGRRGVREAVRPLLLRVPGAVFFFVLLGTLGLEEPALVGYAGAFAAPYLALTWTSVRRPRGLSGSPGLFRRQPSP